MRSFAWCMAALAVACGESAKTPSGPLDRIYRPTGLAVHDGRLLVASSNADLLYDDETGGSVIVLEPALDPAHIPTGGALNVRSFAGDLVVADPVACGLPDALAIFATRGSNTLNTLRLSAEGRLSCERCGTPLSGVFSDPLAVAVACGPARASAFVGYLRAADGGAWITELDLATSLPLRNASIGAGPVRAFAYDPGHDRLYLVGLATAAQTPLRWMQLGGCTLGAAPASGGCSIGTVPIAALPTGIELRSIALAHAFVGAPQRAFLTARRYDTTAARAAGGRTTDFGGVLLVVDLVENALGGVDVRVVREVDMWRGAQDVRVLPQRPGLRDIVAAIAVDDGIVTILDDETGVIKEFRPVEGDSATGAPVLGRQPYGLAVDPELVGTMARLYVGSYGENFVTPIDVPLDAPDATHFAGGTARRITGGTR